MATLNNEIQINAPIEKIWDALSNIDELDKYDPTVEKCTILSKSKNGVGAKRKVSMKDGKNWFDEKCTISIPNKTLAYELTACSFPVHRLNHIYSFENQWGKVKVKQVMNYTVKFGFFGKILDTLIIKRQSNKGIKLFLNGLKLYVEN